MYNVRREDSKRKECKVSRKRRERKGERERKRETERETKGRNSFSKERGANSSSCTIGFLSVTFPTSSKKTLHVSGSKKIQVSSRSFARIHDTIPCFAYYPGPSENLGNLGLVLVGAVKAVSSYA